MHFRLHLLWFTCGEDDVSGHQLVINYGELRQLDPRHSRHGRLASSPVELDVVCGVAICTGRKNREAHTHADIHQGVTICLSSSGGRDI